MHEPLSYLDAAPTPYEDQNSYWIRAGKIRPTVPKPMLAGTVIGVSVLWGVGLIVSRSNNLATTLLWISLFMAAIAMIGSEFYCVLIAVHRVTSLLTSHHWDMLRLTPLTPERLFADLYVSLQLRCWPTQNIEMAIRIIPVTLITLAALQGGLLLNFFAILFSAGGLFLLILGGIFFTYVMEPRWRFGLVLAMSIAVAAKVRSYLFASLAGIAVIGTLHTLQLAIAALPFWVMLSNRSTVWGWLCLLPLSMVLQAAAILWFYRRLCNWALTFAQCELFRQE